MQYTLQRNPDLLLGMPEFFLEGAEENGVTPLLIRLNLSPTEWESMGSPTTITITIEAEDSL